jgi:S1-C subfamily serine protease
MNKLIKANYISSLCLILILCLHSVVCAQETAEKKPTRIIQDLLSEGNEYEPIERVQLSGQFILNRQQLISQVVPDIEQLFERTSQQVFKIIVLDDSSLNSRKVVSMGSGVAINPSTLITNCHVLGSQKIFARLPQEGVNSRLVPLTFIRGDRKTDRCIVRANENIFSPVRGVRLSNTLLPGERVYSVGYPLIFDLSIAEGLISSVKKRGLRSIFLSTAVTGKGSSGGALFDRYGYLIGITTAVITQADHYSLAIPASDYFGP